MRSLLFRIPIIDVPVLAYGTMLVVAMFSSYLVGRRLFRRGGVQIQENRLMDLFVIGVLCGVLGARVLYVVRNLDSFRGTFGAVFKIWEGGLVFHGGIIGGALGAAWFLRRHRIPILKAGDVIMPCLLLGLAWGRIGCFMNGCCYGKVSDSPVAVSFPGRDLELRPDGSPAYNWHVMSGFIDEDAPHSLPVHPTQLYSAVLAALLGYALVLLLQRKRFEGQVMAATALGYGVARFLIEFLRDDEVAVLAGLKRAQIASVVLFGVGLVVYVVCRGRARRGGVIRDA